MAPSHRTPNPLILAMQGANSSCEASEPQNSRPARTIFCPGGRRVCPRLCLKAAAPVGACARVRVLNTRLTAGLPLHVVQEADYGPSPRHANRNPKAPPGAVDTGGVYPPADAHSIHHHSLADRISVRRRHDEDRIHPAAR